MLCSCSLLVFCKHILTYGVYFHLGQGDAEEIKHWENELQRMGCSDSAELPLNSSMGISALPLFAYPCPAGIKLLDDVDWHSLYQETWMFCCDACKCFATMYWLPLWSGNKDWETQDVNNSLQRIGREFLLLYLYPGVWNRLFSSVKMIKNYVS